MVDRGRVAFEEKTLPRKLVQELFVRNSQRRIELENVCKQLNKGKEDCREKFVKTRFELRRQLQQRRCSLAFGTVSAQSPSSEPSHADHALPRASEAREAWPVQSPLWRKPRSKTFCSSSQFNKDDHAVPHGDVTKPKELLKPRPLSEILPPVTLPPIHVKHGGMQRGRGILKTGKGHRAINKDETPSSKTRDEGERQGISRQDTLDDLRDCRYLRGNSCG